MAIKNAAIEELNRKIRALEDDCKLLIQERQTLAREVILKEVLPSLRWVIDEDGESITAVEEIGAEILSLLCADFEGHKFVINRPSEESSLSVEEYISFSSEKDLSFQEIADILTEYKIKHGLVYPDTLPMTDDWRLTLNVSRRDLTIGWSSPEAILSFIEEHHLNVQWGGASTHLQLAQDEARMAQEEAIRAEKVARRKQEHAATLATRLAALGCKVDV